ncbi:probable inactive receptor kinase At4g23740 isoform X1 [Henckelia pumila]|uniref:probable inactive receptor kinase At4g23740 isoform X1 n=1 Tax=Henckelia pumila TaxID=405737 RepID=UPI003C6E4F63
MSRTYDNWERLVAAVLKKEQLWQLFHQQSRSTSFCSDASDLSSSFDLSSPIHDVPFDLSWPGASSPHRKLFEDAVAKLRLLPKLIFISDFSLDFVLEDVLRASSKLLGRGTFGSVYAASMDNGISIAVKRLKLLSILEQDFKKHMEIVGEIRHENVVPLRAYLSSKDEKLMLYDYYYKGSVSALLHGNTGQKQDHVDWETRLRIAVGAAKGISHIHMQNGGKLVHGNIKSSNIFLTPQHYGCISDLGLVNMIQATFMQTARYSRS